MKSELGFIGLGLMGAPMATRLLKAGYPVHVYNRTKEKAKPLLNLGAQWCDSPKEAAAKSEIVFTMVSDPAALESVTLGEKGIMGGIRPGGIHVDTSTVSPKITGLLEKEYQRKRALFLHAPVLGSIPQATDGTLLLFVGGPGAAFEHAEPVLKTFGSKIWRFESVQQATHTKLLCNFFIAGMISLLSQALVFGKQASIDLRGFLEILSHSALNAPTYQTKGASMIDRNFAPRFFLEHMLKDIRLLLDAGKELGVPLPTGEVAEHLFSEAIRRGYGKEDYSAVVKVVESAAGVIN